MREEVHHALMMVVQEAATVYVDARRCGNAEHM